MVANSVPQEMADRSEELYLENLLRSNHTSKPQRIIDAAALQRVKKLDTDAKSREQKVSPCIYWVEL